jgi:hypothetical protein
VVEIPRQSAQSLYRNKVRKKKEKDTPFSVLLFTPFPPKFGSEERKLALCT